MGQNQAKPSDSGLLLDSLTRLPPSGADMGWDKQGVC